MIDASDETKATENKNLPALLGPLMVTHLAVTRDLSQHRQWRARVEEILQSDAVERAVDPKTKSLLANKTVWRRLRSTGKTGAAFGLALSTFWLSWLLPAYAIDHGFGWSAALAYLLPIPMAWTVGRKLWESAAVAGMRDLGTHPSMRRRLRGWFRGALRSYLAGFGFGFTLTFLQGLISWFMTPAPTLFEELILDASLGTLLGATAGGISVMLTPMISQAAPALSEGSKTNPSHLLSG